MQAFRDSPRIRELAQSLVSRPDWRQNPRPPDGAGGFVPPSIGSYEHDTLQIEDRLRELLFGSPGRRFRTVELQPRSRLIARALSWPQSAKIVVAATRVPPLRQALFEEVVVHQGP